MSDQPTDTIDGTDDLDGFGRWQRTNEEHLVAALAWLRLRLGHLAHSDASGGDASISAPPIAPTVRVEEPGRGRRRRRSRRAEAAPPPTTTPATPIASAGGPSGDEVAAAEATMLGLEDGPDRPALVELADRFGLSRFERDTLLLGASVELAPALAPLCARAQGDPALAHPTFALAFVLFDGPAWESLSAERPLRGARLIELTHAPDAALVTSPFRADERVVSYLKGLNQLDDRISPYVVPLGTGSPPVDPTPSQRALGVRLADRLAASGEATPPVVHLVGSPGANSQLVAAEVARQLGRLLLRVPVAGLPGATAELDRLSRLWERERALLPLALYLDAAELPTDPVAAEAATAVISRVLGRTGGVRFLDGPDASGPVDALTVEVGGPTADEQRALWRSALGHLGETCAPSLAAQFDLDPVAVSRAARTAVDAAPPEGDTADTLLDRVWEECLALTRPRLDALAQRIEPYAGWDDLVLSEEASELLALLVQQVRLRSTVYDDWGLARTMNRGLGITALFAGESGTGKTMAAEVIARDLRLDLYRIDLSAVVSKYIGETEKNLRRVFDAAEGAGTLLFFDEADALFGKRTEVKDSHDRYANIEVNYLLQRMEAYRGLAVLATNRRAALDPALVRRLRVVVEFPFPGVDQRTAIWRGAFGEGVPTDDLDLDRLATMSLSGGSIHNAALDATFGAAAAGSAVTMPLVLAAIGRELRKQGRPVNDGDLRWDEPEMAR